MKIMSHERLVEVCLGALDKAKNEGEKNIIAELLKNLSKSEDKSTI